ncbi:HAD-IA family hydrolase [Flavobacterium coralii]|uniref:HAD-IA family hydrolase n=1 Tax=Flavobacterium coralii TaxID=2838017 RepID=UPI000C351FF8|nr:haloacid dehalogenase [Flavobacterium sp.]|tara:strand:- start:73989 stop:74606 length:618 start_codon:yes stop_codon:yes gene_type:complete
MVNTIVFDFGDVFINKNSKAKDEALASLGLTEWNEDLEELEKQLETGVISAKEFLKGLQPYTDNASLEAIKEAWNAGIENFPLYRLEFLQKLATSYRLFLLSNTDPIHIEKFEHDSGASFYSDFYQCFEKVYFSHEIGIRKPDEGAYNYLINNHDIQPKRTLLVDDKKFNTDAAEALGFKVWRLQKGSEDVTELFDKKIIPFNEA